MTNLAVDVSGFLGNYTSLNGRTPVSISKRQCIKAAQTVGVQVLRSGTATAAHALTMATYKSMAIRAAIDFSRPNLGCVYQFRRLETSERANISFWIGMTFASIAANRILGVPRLLHAGPLRDLGQLTLTNPLSRKLADLVGQDASNDWHVIEAKGRQRTPSSPDLTKWKIQAGTISAVNGASTATMSYCVTRLMRQYRVDLVNPPKRETTTEFLIRDPVAATIDLYYGVFRDVLIQTTSAVSREGTRMRLSPIAYDPIDREYIFVGMNELALKHIVNGQLPPSDQSVEGDDYYLGEDGIAIVSSTTPSPDGLEIVEPMVDDQHRER